MLLQLINYIFIIISVMIIYRSVRPENPIRQNSSNGVILTEPISSTSKNGGHCDDSQSVSDEFVPRDLSKRFAHLSIDVFHEIESETAEPQLETVILQQYEDQVEKLKNTIKQMTNVIEEKNAEIEDLKKSYQSELKNWKDASNLSTVSAETYTFYNIGLYRLHKFYNCLVIPQ